MGSDDEIGGTDGGDPEQPQAVPANVCLVEHVPGFYGYRHHCGGTFAFSFTGTAADEPIDVSAYIGFGPTQADPEIEPFDTYETPIVAACCGGPYDFGGNSIDQYNYFENCKFDAVQQLCLLAPNYILNEAKDKGDVAKAIYTSVANDMLSQSNQNACIASLFEEVIFDDEGNPLPGNHYLRITDTSWHYSTTGVSLTISVDDLEILETYYPPAPDSPATCEDVFENDANIIPLIDGLADGASPEHLTIASGMGELGNESGFGYAIDPEDGYLSVAVAPSENGALLEIRNLIVRTTNPTRVVFGSMVFPVDTWTIGMVGSTTAPVVGSPTNPLLGSATYPAGSITFVANVKYDGELYTRAGWNADDITLTQTSQGWAVSGLRLELDDDGVLWDYTLTDLSFEL